ncbi:dTDP-4-dehydrorhamnose reductase [Rhizobium sp. BK077]|uniref:dTDP-4-dehydrorhamnose reductase n=1 Tax=Rhizobium TaxID=379 RepID=UPI0007B50436|nr:MULTISPECIES: dTDP-4-dehydrorhamnose reductase [Rhizobium]KZS49379.1 NAD(P)-dependent oxidoreductase [Rhizobium anhuiense bv. trifolii]MBB3297545.1 dTDP-4-dehydrorhamnose reductase [Rhizobium sp. BK112]MBB3367058.1 dTDP-4-dehydrorhamnose reductase [Rhizobium sp. BK077]MBB4177960.1 dTDP-4-dehydrorhamnose reductase [Rhizobium sp. BK109]
MRIAVTGKSGQVTSALQALKAPDIEVITIGRPELDLLAPSMVRETIAKLKPDVVVSSAAYTAVDKAESDEAAAFAINRDGAGAIAAAAAELSIPVIHLSTDYVFDGDKLERYVESDPVGPVSVYGRSKLEGEYAVAAANENHVILRTAWVYSTFGHNFVKTMLRLAETRDELSVVSDQLGCPTSANDIAEAIVKIAARLSSDSSPDLRGVFHLAGSGETNWAEFARYILSILEEKTGRRVIVRDIATADYPTAAKRPANSRLCCDKLKRLYGVSMPEWQVSTRTVVTKLLEEPKEAV